MLHSRPHNGILAWDCQVDYGGSSAVCLDPEPIEDCSALTPKLCEVIDTHGAQPAAQIGTGKSKCPAKLVTHAPDEV